MNENVDYDKMWEEIIDLTRSETSILLGEKTVKMFADEAGISEHMAKVILEKYVQENKMRKRFVQNGRARIVVYSPVLDTAK